MWATTWTRRCIGRYIQIVQEKSLYYRLAIVSMKECSPPPSFSLEKRLLHMRKNPRRSLHWLRRTLTGSVAPANPVGEAGRRTRWDRWDRAGRGLG